MERLQALLDRLELVTHRLELASNLDMYRTSPIRTVSGGEVKNTASVREFHELIAGPLSEFISLSAKIGDVVKTQAALVEKCFFAEEDIIKLASSYSKPSETEFQQIIQACGKQIEEVVQFKDSNRSGPYANHLSAVADSISALGWITISPAPVPYIRSMQEAGEFYTNRVIKEYKGKDVIHSNWAKALMNVWNQLQVYVKKCHTTGLVWNTSGKPATASALAKSSPTREMPSAPTSGGAVAAPPPPPMLTPSILKEMGALTTHGDSGAAALFADINRGEAVTAGLRKVTDDMKTHKHPELRAAGTVSSQNKPSKFEAAGNRVTSGCLELRGNKWAVENFSNVRNLQIVDTENKQTVYIYKCDECTIEIRGKINSIMIDNCQKTGVVFDHLISSIDIVNCRGIQIQSTGQLSTVSIDKTDGCQVYLSKESKNADIITAKSSEVNVLIPKPDGEFEEFPVPEQFKTNFNGKNLVTVPMDSA